MTPEQHAAHIRELEFKLYKAEHGLGMPYSREDVAHYRRLLEQARRAAAAPDLLAALKALVEPQDLADLRIEDWQNARAAIAKAEGTQ